MRMNSPNSVYTAVDNPVINLAVISGASLHRNPLRLNCKGSPREIRELNGENPLCCHLCHAVTESGGFTCRRCVTIGWLLQSRDRDMHG